MRKLFGEEKFIFLWRRQINRYGKEEKFGEEKCFFKECTEMLLASAFCEVFLVFFYLEF